MPAAKRSASGKSPAAAPGPAASRPAIRGYGIPESTKGLLPWEHVARRMAEAQLYWVSTVSLDGRPHVTPVDGVWFENVLYFGGSPGTRRNRNLAANPAAAVHLESGRDVVILHGEAREIRELEPELARKLAAATKAKYGYGPEPESYTQGGAFAFRPSVAFAWSNFPKDVTRWTFAADG